MPKFCTHCGAELKEEQNVCLNCGCFVNEQNQVEVNDNEIKNDNAADKTLVFGLIGLVAWFLPICGYIIGVLGIVYACKGMKSINKKRKAIVGLVLIILCIVASVINSILGIMMINGRI